MEAAIVVDNIKKDQLLFDITNQSKIHDIVIYSDKEDCSNFNFGFSILSNYDLWNSKTDNIIVTSINSCLKALNNPKLKKIFFYVWDLEWLREIYNYEFISNIYLNKKVELVARSEDHALFIEKTWNILPRISHNFDIIKIIGEQNEKINI